MSMLPVPRALPATQHSGRSHMVLNWPKDGVFSDNSFEEVVQQ